MKKLLLFAIALVTTIAAYAQSFNHDGITYTVLNENDRTCKLSSGNDASGDIEIPATVPYNSEDYAVTSIGDRSFYKCTSLTSITLPKGLTSIGDDTFYGCSSLTSITLPERLTSIGNSAFWYCSSLTSITLPGGLSSIGVAPFFSCTSLTDINVDDKNLYFTSIDGVLFSKDRNTLICCPARKEDEYIVPEGVTSIRYVAFNYCTSLTSITIPESLTSMGSAAFYECTSLTSITLPKGLSSISDHAFYGCSSLTSITLPKGLSSIGEGAFFYCTSLTSITLPEGLSSIAYDAFYECSSLTEINVDDKNLYFTPIDGVLFSKDKNTLICCPPGKEGEYIVPEGVTSIGSHAFYHCRSLNSITIPEGLSSIDIGAFANCTSLTSITLPKSLTSISEYAFFYCTSLTDVYSYSSNPPVCGDYEVFVEIPSKAVLHVPEGCRDTYAAARGWSVFKNIVDDLESESDEPAEPDTCVEMHVSESNVEICVNSETELIVSLKGLKEGRSTLTLTLTDDNGEETVETVVINVVKDTLDVENLFADEEDKAVNIYTLGGVMIRQNVSPQAVLELRAGIYIVGDKKVLVR